MIVGSRDNRPSDKLVVWMWEMQHLMCNVMWVSIELFSHLLGHSSVMCHFHSSFVCACFWSPAPQRNFEIAFKMFDLNGDGEVDLEEFEQVCLGATTWIEKACHTLAHKRQENSESTDLLAGLLTHLSPVKVMRSFKLLIVRRKESFQQKLFYVQVNKIL